MRLFWITLWGVAFLDALSKAILSKILPPKKVVIPGFFNLVKIRNPGIAFGLFADWGEAGRFILAGLSLGVLILLIWQARRENARGQIALGMVAGGALANAWDRLWHGGVFDFLDFHLGKYHWPAFNLADTAITLGVVLYLWRLRS